MISLTRRELATSSTYRTSSHRRMTRLTCAGKTLRAMAWFLDNVCGPLLVCYSEERWRVLHAFDWNLLTSVGRTGRKGVTYLKLDWD